MNFLVYENKSIDSQYRISIKEIIFYNIVIIN